MNLLHDISKGMLASLIRILDIKNFLKIKSIKLCIDEHLIGLMLSFFKYVLNRKFSKTIKKFHFGKSKHRLFFNQKERDAL